MDEREADGGEEEGGVSDVQEVGGDDEEEDVEGDEGEGGDNDTPLGPPEFLVWPVAQS